MNSFRGNYRNQNEYTQWDRSFLTEHSYFHLAVLAGKILIDPYIIQEVSGKTLESAGHASQKAPSEIILPKVTI